ncbi:hypothetical protein LTS18_004353, partial [Coniosporium uncinatum]
MGAWRPTKDQDVVIAAPTRGDAFAGRNIEKETTKEIMTKKETKTYPRPMTRRNTEDWCKPVTILDLKPSEVFEKANAMELALPPPAHIGQPG